VDHPSFLAIDLGAGSGRAILGTLVNDRLRIEELHRFPNRMIEVFGHLHWNLFSLYEEMKEGLKACVAKAHTQPRSLAIDTWGVDYALLAADGSFLGLPHTYRDARTEGAMDAFFERLPREEVYGMTGIQFMPFNTLFQLFAMQRDRSPLVDAAHDLLFMPDAFNYLLTGCKKTEFTFATTSQLFNPVQKAWEPKLFHSLDLPLSWMQEVVHPVSTDCTCKDSSAPRP